MLEPRSAAGIAALACSLVLSGCDVARIAARSSAAIAERAAPGMEQYFDYEIAGSAMPTTIVQLEGMIRVDASNRRLLLQLTKSYVGYGYGWVEDRVEQLEMEQGDYRAGAEQRARAHRMYLRARDLGLYLMSLDARGGHDAIARGEAAFREWLERRFRDRGDAPVLFWTGSAWGSAIGTSEEGLADSADLPLARALVERSVALDPDFSHAAGMGFLGAVEASVPGGDLERSRELFEQAIARTDRHALALLVNMANTYAVQAEDRVLYERLLHEVLAAEDVDSTARLANLVAKRRAQRYLDQIDARFP